jgi:hypothetical protein
LSSPSYVANPAGEEAAAAPARRRVRIPKALLVTALGFALTAWLVPAMTRQWDDRQKEHALEAAVVGDMGKDSAQALVGGEEIWSGQKLSKSQRAQIGKQWELAALEMEARLRTYFSPAVVRSWEVYSWAVDRFIDARNVSASAELQDAVTKGSALDPGVVNATAELIALSEYPWGPGPTFVPDSKTHNSDTRNIAALKKMLSPQLRRDERVFGHTLAKWTALEKDLLALEQAVADQVLRSHAEGFSTTGHDLLHDLMP